MKNLWLTALMCGALIFMLSTCNQSTSGEENHTGDQESADSGPFAPTTNKFPDFGYMLSEKDLEADYPDTEVFKLSQDYPSTMPPKSKIPAFLDIPFDEGDNWREYIDAVQDYCFEGMIEVDFIAQKNTVRNWYHMPWMHWGPQGTEGFNGLAKEAQISPYQLTLEQNTDHQTYALGYYNEFAGHVLHEMWKDPRNPNPKATSKAHGGGFPVGTVIFKLLYTDADETQVDYLVNPYSIKGYVTTTWDDINREVKDMQLIQMDFMVRDPRADKYGTGWVFGTYCYNGKLNNGKTGARRALNLVPVGVQWGNDPDITTNKINVYPPSETKINLELKETKINPNTKELPPQHLGWGGRLDGPVDLNTASCMSCHATAGFPQSLAPLVPAQAFIGPKNKDGSITHLTETSAPEWIKYYTNIECGTPYEPEQISCDFSLQVSLALGYFYDWKVNEDGLYHKNYDGQKDTEHAPTAQRGAAPHKESHDLD